MRQVFSQFSGGVNALCEADISHREYPNFPEPDGFIRWAESVSGPCTRGKNQIKDLGTLSHGPALQTLGLEARLSHDQGV